MSSIQTTHATAAARPAVPAARPGGLRFASAAQRASACAELSEARFVVARIDVGGVPGMLRAVLDDAVEGALASRGALPPTVALGASLEATIADQIFRVRALGARGLVLAPPALARFVGPGGSLEPEDSAALGAWIQAAEEGPLLVLLDEADRDVHVLVPRRLGALAAESSRRAEPRNDPPESGPISSDAESEPTPVAPMARRAAKESPRKTESEVVAAEAPSMAMQLDGADAQDQKPVMAVTPKRKAAPVIAVVAPAQVEEPAPAEPPIPPRAARVVDAAEWRAHAVELDAARGPKPIATIEKLFANHYCPLLGAVASGGADAAVREVVEDWRTSFEHSYKDAFAALRVTGKRPSMVFDAPEIASRMARLNGARKTSLLLVDAMRFDLGERVVERVKAMTAGRALCVERVVLWSALPTTTPTQMALLGRGPEGLKEAAPASDPEPMIERGRAVATIRRERAGAREVMKLDLVEARLRTAGPALDDRLDRLADEVAPVVARHIDSLAPRTMLFLFGDHGFRLPSHDGGRATGPATQGGASPEEVLVPGYAWLVDGVH